MLKRIILILNCFFPQKFIENKCLYLKLAGFSLILIALLLSILRREIGRTLNFNGFSGYFRSLQDTQSNLIKGISSMRTESEMAHGTTVLQQILASQYVCIYVRLCFLSSHYIFWNSVSFKPRLDTNALPRVNIQVSCQR